MLIGRRHAGGKGHQMALRSVLKSCSGKPHHPAGVGGTKGTGSVPFLMSLAVVTVVLPVITVGETSSWVTTYISRPW
jgi:hypothetical protein